MQCHLILYRPEEAETFGADRSLTRGERRLEVSASDVGVKLTLIEAPSAANGHAVQQVAWTFTDSERALLLAMLAATPPGDLNAGTEVDPRVKLATLDREWFIARSVLEDMHDSRGHEFSEAVAISVANALVAAGLAIRLTDSAGVTTYHPTAAGRFALGLEG